MTSSDQVQSVYEVGTPGEAGAKVAVRLQESVRRHTSRLHANSPIIDIQSGRVLPPSSADAEAIDTNSVLVSDIVDDPPIPVRGVYSDSRPDDGNVEGSVQALLGTGTGCVTSYFPPRGASLVPPYDGKLIYYDALGPGYQLRRLDGVECLGDARNFQIGLDQVFKSSVLTQYGASLVHDAGYEFEGCFQTGPGPWTCDFKVSGHSRRLTASQNGVAYARRVLEQWSSYQLHYLGACGTSIVGLWTGQHDLNDVATSCVDFGPFQPN